MNWVQKFISWVQAFNDYFLTSVSLRALPQNEKIKHIFAEVKKKGEVEYRFFKMPVLGNSGAGKTSLLRHLRELKFQVAHTATRAADLHNIEISRVDDQWKDIVEPVDEEERATLEYTAEQIISKEKKSNDISVPHFLVCNFFLLVNLILHLGRQELNCGFSPLLFASTLLIGLTGIETVVRYGQGGAIGIFVLQVTLSTPVLTAFQNYTLPMLVAFIVGITVLGAGYSCGFRVGIAAALCIFHLPSHDSIYKVLEYIYFGEFQSFLDFSSYYLGTLLGGNCYLLTSASNIPTVLKCIIWSMMVSVSIYLSVANLSPQILNFLLGLHYPFWIMVGVVDLGEYLVTNYEIRYWPKRIGGFFIGSTMAQALGMELILWQVHDIWKILESFIGLVFIICLEYMGYQKVNSKNKLFNCVDLRTSIKNKKLGKKGIPIHLHVIDFAGDAVYYVAKQILMPQNAIYIVVFDFVMAKTDFGKQLEDLVYWLNLVSSHVHIEGSVPSVFIVGTHRDSVDRDLRKNIANELTKHLQKSCKFLVQNKNSSSCLYGTLVFEVENKVSLAEDDEACYVKQKIINTAMELSFLKEKVPIKWLKFPKVQERLMKSGKSVITLAELREETEDFVPDENDFKQMIHFFNRRGDIIHKNSGDYHKQYVVLDQTVLIDTVIKLATFSNKKGCVPLTKYTLETAVQVTKIQPEIMVDLLKTCELVIEYKERGERLLVLPNRLPKYENGSSGRERPLWTDKETDQHVYIDMKNTNRHSAQNVFLCLLVKCHTASGESYFLDDASDPLIYSNMARLHYHPDMEGQQTSHPYKLTVLNPTAFQNVIQVTTRGTPDMAIYGILSMLHRFLQELRQDFLDMGYIMGPAETEALDCRHNNPQNHIHVYDLVNEKSKEFPSGEISICCPCTTGTPMTVHVPVQDHKETETHFKNLKANWSSFEDQLNPIPVLSYLLEKNILAIHDKVAIENAYKTSRKEGCSELLKRLCECSPEKDPIHHFCIVLHDKSFLHLADLLEPPPDNADDTAVKSL